MRKIAGWCRWLARLAATAMAALFITYLAGEGTPDLREISDQEIAGFAAVFLLLIGTLAGWWRDLVGGGLLVLGYGAFYFIERGWPPLPFAAFAIAGVLLLLSALLRLLERRAAARTGGAAAAAP